MPRTITFDRSFPYWPPSPSPIPRRPYLVARVYHPINDSLFVNVRMLVDSGADTVCLPSQFLSTFQLAPAALSAANTAGVGGTQVSQQCPNMRLYLLEQLVEPCPVSFIPNLPVCLLGRAVFDRFCFAFDQSAWRVHVRMP